MIAVFAATAFIPTGPEVAVAGGTTVAAQKVLEAIFGDQAVRTLAANGPRRTCWTRVAALLDEEAGRYLSRARRRRRRRGRRRRGCAGRGGRGRRRPARRQRPVRRREDGAAVSSIAGRIARRSAADQRGRRRRAGRPRRRAAPVRRRRRRPRAGRRAGRRAHAWSTGPATGSRCPGTTPWSRWPAPPAAASPACSTRWPAGASPVGVRRPTTGVAHACVWGAGGRRAAARLARRAARPPVRPGERAGRRRRGGPARAGPARPARLRLGRGARTGSRWTGCWRLVDLVVWVLDPQKYADRVVHEQYLRAVPPAPRRHRGRAQPGRPARPRPTRSGCLADLRRLLDADGLAGVPAAGHLRHRASRAGGLRDALERTVAERQAALRRLAGDVDAVVAGLASRWSAPRPRGRAGRPAAVDRLDRRAGRRGRGAERWPRPSSGRTGTGPPRPPAGRWSAGLRRLRPDPLRRLHLPGPPATGRPGAACRGHLGAGARRPPSGRRSGWPSARSPTGPAAELPAPWPGAVDRRGPVPPRRPAGRAGRAVAGTDLGLARRPAVVAAGRRCCSGWSPSPPWSGWAGWCSATRCASLGLPALDDPQVGRCRCRPCCCSAGCWPGCWWRR